MNRPLPTTAFDKAKPAASALRLRIAAFLSSIRFEITLALLIGVPLPAVIRQMFEAHREDLLSYDNSVIGTFAAVALGFLIYRKVTSLPGTQALLRLLPAFVISYLSVAALFFALRLDFSRQQFLVSFVLVVLFFYAMILVTNRIRKPVYGYVRGGRADSLASIGLADWIRFDTVQQARNAAPIPVVADLNHAGLTPEWERFLADAAISGRRVYNAKQLRESILGRTRIDHLSENSFGHLAPDSLYAPTKAYIDFVAAALVLAFIGPLLIVIGLLIRLESPGPAIFRQERMGHGGRAFTLYKFRSMRVRSADETGHRADMTQSDDARITPIGRFIRRSRIDELPQIINILLGQMSWIGPRPETVALSEWYEKQIPFYRYRHIVRPGITGWAQIKQGHVTSVQDVEEKLEFDFYYVRNFSVWLDMLIVAYTVRVVLTGHGAK